MSSLERLKLSALPGREVEPEHIRAELIRAWREAAELDRAREPTEEERAAARLRPVLANLILVDSAVADSSVSLLSDTLITHLAVVHPSRFFVVRVFPGGEPTGELFLRTSVSSRCVLAQSKAHICTEEVNIWTDLGSFDAVPNLLTSLFVSDVARILVLGGHTRETFVPRLYELADRVVFDSSRVSSFARDLRFLGDRIETSSRERDRSPGSPASSHPVIVRDVGWARIRRWREVVAEEFDAPRMQDFVGKLRRIELTTPQIETRSCLPHDALLLLGWLADRLGWEPMEGDSPESGCQVVRCSGGEEIRIQRQQAKKSSEQRLFLPGKLSFVFQSDGEAGALHFERPLQEKMVSIVPEGIISDSLTGSTAGVSRRAVFTGWEDDSSILPEILTDSPDPAFRKAFCYALRIAELIETDR